MFNYLFFMLPMGNIKIFLPNFINPIIESPNGILQFSFHILTFLNVKLLYIMYRQKGSVAMDDRELIRRIKSGDTKALDELIQKYYNDIYTYCYRRLGHKHDAQDITQEVFLHFCRNFNSYMQRGKCKNYLYVIAHNLCVNAIRKRTPIPLKDIGKENSPIKDAEGEKFETADSVKAALNALPEEQKEVIQLRFYHDLKLKDIAQIMDSGLSVTKYRLNQGLKSLSKLLSKEDWL